MTIICIEWFVNFAKMESFLFTDFDDKGRIRHQLHLFFNDGTRILILSPTFKDCQPDDENGRINQWLVNWRRGTCNRMMRFKTAWGHYMTYTLALILRWHKKWFQQRSHTEPSWSETKQTDWTDWALLNPSSDSIKIIDFYQIRWRTLDLVRLSYISSFFFVLG